MPKAKTGNFTLRRIVTGCPADKAAHRYLALQRSGAYSELRMIQRGKSKIDIVGYKWPDKSVRRKLGIGRARINPAYDYGEKVLFHVDGTHQRVGLITGTHFDGKIKWFVLNVPTGHNKLVSMNVLPEWIIRRVTDAEYSKLALSKNPQDYDRRKTVHFKSGDSIMVRLVDSAGKNVFVPGRYVEHGPGKSTAWVIVADPTTGEAAKKRIVEKYDIRKNPSEKGAITPNQVKFGMRGHTKVGWINRETKTRYWITYKDGAQTRHVWRDKDKVKFVLTGRKGRVKNTCPKTANPPEVDIHTASEMFHQRPARFQPYTEFFDWPKKLPMIGPCTMIEYVSDKFDGKVRRYYHKFGKGTRVYFAPSRQRNGESILIIRGPFTIKPEGITG